jgi:hypothetical protein
MILALVLLFLDFVRRIPVFFRLVMYTPVPRAAIDANGFRKPRPMVYEKITYQIDRFPI